MKSKWSNSKCNFFSVGLLCFLSGSLVSAGLRVGLAETLASVESINGLEISQELKAKVPDDKKLKSWQQKTEKSRADFSRLVKISTPFVRGEIEDERVINIVTRFLQLSILDCRLQISKKELRPCANEIGLWFQFTADLAYEESSLISLRFTHLVRSLWLDELEKFAREEGLRFASAQDWISSLRAPWPIDRVVMSEGRRVLTPAKMKIAEKVALAFQKNPYQTIEEIMKKIPKSQSPELDFIKKIWRKEDLEQMATEMNRINTLRILAAKSRYEIINKKKAQNFDELIKATLLNAVPIDYSSGRPMVF
jgi:hypothetical protein